MLSKKADVIVVDAGNTRIKVAAFLDDQIIRLDYFQVNQNQAFYQFLSFFKEAPIFVSSVLSDEDLNHFLGNEKKYLLFSRNLNLPIKIAYDTPQSLGLDRLANAAAIQILHPEGNKVAIDLGTCIKFDFVNENGTYLGGSISPGLTMRYEALNHFTGKLPLLHAHEPDTIIGTNTHDSIHSGVMLGMKGEINQFMERYSQDYQGLTFFVTGGDMKYFEFPSKNNIFAHENLTLFGLNYIYKRNG
jgi:type III pantothenate kinase